MPVQGLLYTPAFRLKKSSFRSIFGPSTYLRQVIPVFIALLVLLGASRPDQAIRGQRVRIGTTRRICCSMSSTRIGSDCWDIFATIRPVHRSTSGPCGHYTSWPAAPNGSCAYRPSSRRCSVWYSWPSWRGGCCLIRGGFGRLACSPSLPSRGGPRHRGQALRMGPPVYDANIARGELLRLSVASESPNRIVCQPFCIGTGFAVVFASQRVRARGCRNRVALSCCANPQTVRMDRLCRIRSTVHRLDDCSPPAHPRATTNAVARRVLGTILRRHVLVFRNLDFDRRLRRQNRRVWNQWIGIPVIAVVGAGRLVSLEAIARSIAVVGKSRRVGHHREPAARLPPRRSIDVFSSPVHFVACRGSHRHDRRGRLRQRMAMVARQTYFGRADGDAPARGRANGANGRERTATGPSRSLRLRSSAQRRSRDLLGIASAGVRGLFPRHRNMPGELRRQ